MSESEWVQALDDAEYYRLACTTLMKVLYEHELEAKKKTKFVEFSLWIAVSLWVSGFVWGIFVAQLVW